MNKSLLWKIPLAVCALLVPLAASQWEAPEVPAVPAWTSALAEPAAASTAAAEAPAAISPRLLARAFSLPLPPGDAPPEAPPAVEAPGPEPPPPEENRYTLLGKVRSGGAPERIYIKDTESGRIIPVGTGEQAEETAYLVDTQADAYIIRVDRRLFKVWRISP
jgi:hypothetical protein